MLHFRSPADKNPADALQNKTEVRMNKPVIPQARVFLDDRSALCIVRDITLDCPASPCGQITILGRPVDVRFSSHGDGCYVVVEPYPAEIEVFFREEPTEQERERHPFHVQNNIYRGGCPFCDCEQ